MSAHTPTPWHTGIPMLTDGVGIYGTDHCVAILDSESGVDDVAEIDADNAVRIVECVNACEGLTEPGKVAQLIGEMRRRLYDDNTLPMQRFVAQQVFDILGVSS